MWKEYLKNNKYLIGSLFVLALGVSAIVFFIYSSHSKKETSQMKDLSTAQMKEGVVENKKSNSKNITFDEKSSQASDGTPILQGNYNIEDIVQIAALKEGSTTSDYNPTKEQAVKQAYLNAPGKPIFDEGAVVKMYDTVTVSVIGKIGGVEKKYLTDQQAKFVIGETDRRKDDKLAEALVGLKLKETTTKEITYPEDYKLDQLAGQTVSYDLTVTTITRPTEPSESDIEAIYNTLKESSSYSNKNKKLNSVKQEVIEKSTVKAYPASVIKSLENEYQNFSFGVDYKDEESYFKGSKVKPEEYYAGRSEYVIARIKKQLILEYLSKKAGITMESEDFKKLDSPNFNADERRDILFELVLTKLV